MTVAPLTQQRQLLRLQELDQTLARLAHERAHLPVLDRISQAVASLKQNKRDAVVAAAALADAKREATRREDEVTQVARRAEVLRERLASGAAGARDLTAIQGEIDQLGRRQGVLEEAQLEAMAALESAQAEVDRLAAQEQEIRAAGREMTAHRDQEFARLDADKERVAAQRAELASVLDAALVAEYDATRQATGGLGVVALYGRRVEGDAVEISPQEWARIAAAPADAVLHAEDSDVILVRMED